MIDCRHQWSSLGYRGVWKKVYLCKDTKSAAKLIIEIDGAIALDTSEVERWINLLGRVKSSRRNRMSNDLLNHIMFLRLHEPRYTAFNLYQLHCNLLVCYRCMQQLEKLCPEILKISRADSARGRYQSKWKV